MLTHSPSYLWVSFILVVRRVCVVDDRGNDDSHGDAWFSDWVQMFAEHRHFCTTAVHITHIICLMVCDDWEACNTPVSSRPIYRDRRFLWRAASKLVSIDVLHEKFTSDDTGTHWTRSYFHRIKAFSVFFTLRALSHHSPAFSVHSIIYTCHSSPSTSSLQSNVKIINRSFRHSAARL